MKYLLEKEDLSLIALLNGLPPFYDLRPSYNDKLKKWDEKIFNILFEKQPELKSLYDKFKEELKTEKKGNIIFAEIFANKIELESSVGFIFDVDYGFKGKLAERIKLFKKLHEKNKDFLVYLHNRIKSNSNNDDYLFDSYFQLMKSKKSDKSIFTKQEVLENIKNFYTGDVFNLCQKKINAYLSLFDRTQALYDFITQDMNNILKKSALINNFWEEKFELFPDCVKKEEQKLEMKTHYGIKNFSYHFALNGEWLIRDYKFSKAESESFPQNFNKGLLKIIKEKYTVEVNSSSNSIFKISSDYNDIINECMNICNQAVKYLPDLLKDSTLDFKDDEWENKTYNFLLNINKYILSKELEQSLSDKNLVTSKKKI